MKTKKIVAVVLSACLLLGTAVVANADEVQTDETMETISIETEVVDETEAVFETEVTSETDAMVEEIEISETDAVTEELPETEPEAEVTEAVPEVTEEVQETENLYDYESITSYYDADFIEYAICDLSVRAIADPNAEVVTVIPNGSEVHVVGYSWDSPWYKIEVNGVYGYVNCLNILSEYNPDFPIYSDAEAEAIFAD